MACSGARRRGARYQVGGLGGAVSFALAGAYHAFPAQRFLLGWGIVGIVGQGGLEGAVWGLATGVGLVWVLNSPQPRWLTVPLVVAFSTAVFLGIRVFPASVWKCAAVGFGGGRGDAAAVAGSVGVVDTL